MKPGINKVLQNYAVEIEFLVISVIQGMALQMLAVAASTPLSMLQVEYWFAIVSAFILILIFWSQAVLHALSFINWPIDIVHTCIYFLASFVEVMAFNHVTNPLKWFVFGFVFLIISGLLYLYDLLMIRRRRKDFIANAARRALFQHMYTQQVKEMKLFLPGALLFSGISAWLIYTYPVLFIDHHFHAVLSGIQMLLSIGLLAVTIQTFKRRSQLLENSLTI
ncbi:hypothetical protein HY468_04435 [Candidatus Roizmanbacteria bacterium]|nr:hypothetical protein [Candidatus Roizmanbacteria bacterium]